MNNSMTFTSTPPSRPGFYALQYGEHGTKTVIELSRETMTGRLYTQPHGEFIDKWQDGILWCHLLPAEEVEKAKAQVKEAYFEALDNALCLKPHDRTSKELWEDSNARKIVEGNV